MDKTTAHQAEHCFTDKERDAVYKSIYLRRDVRSQFKPDAIPDDVLARIINAAHHAPSVGFMQPWNFLLIKELATKQKIHDIFLNANEEAVQMFTKEQGERYRKLKLEGILDAPLNMVITCDRDRIGPVVLGRTHDKAMDLFSSVCAVQNLWLAARAEGVGVGWVSIFNKKALKQALKLPKSITPVAYLCIGYVDHFLSVPELQTAGWQDRLAVEDLLCFEQWGNTATDDHQGLINELSKPRVRFGNTMILNSFLNSFLTKVNTQPDNIEFTETMAVIDENYNFTEAQFSNGELVNKAGENSGSCKLFAFTQLQNLSKEQTLACFGAYYRDDVLQNPDADNHQNIRNFIKHGWSGISFVKAPLQKK